MANKLSDIKAPIATELELFEQRFKESMRSHVPLLDRITFYIVKRKGKQIRPLLVLLCAKLYGEEISESSYTGASLVELLHTATLVHDDVVDEADKRRGFFSINALWKNKVAVLVGDYLLSKGLLLALEDKQHDSLELLSRAIKEMSEGELLQIEKTRMLDIEEETYFRIIRGKTASLIAAACAIGASTAGASPEEVRQMHEFGEKMGMAFQIRDDLFDFGDKDVGKPLGIDIKEKKLTLPLIYALRQASPREQRRYKKIIRRHHDNKRKVAEVIAFVHERGGLDYAREVMMRFRDEALAILKNFPENAARESLEKLLFFVTVREK